MAAPAAGPHPRRGAGAGRPAGAGPGRAADRLTPPVDAGSVGPCGNRRALRGFSPAASLRQLLSGRTDTTEAEQAEAAEGRAGRARGRAAGRAPAHAAAPPAFNVLMEDVRSGKTLLFDRNEPFTDARMKGQPDPAGSPSGRGTSASA
ncbi:hypothetical protein GCM10010206_32410 [Streptomyces cinerochromogenes]|nr:hypothetical protein GCM10010206_32410 [Streptomyces cinerochromogenes]